MKKIIKIGAPIALLAVPIVAATSCGIKLHQKTNKNNVQNGGNGNKPTQPGGGNGNNTGGGNGNWNKPTQPGGGSGTNTGGNGNWNKPTQPGGGNGNWNKPTQPGGGSGTNTGGTGNWNKPTQPGGGTGTNTGGNWNKPTQPGGGTGTDTGRNGNWNKPTQPGGGTGTNTGGNGNWNKPTQPGGGTGTNTGGNGNWNKPTQPGGGTGTNTGGNGNKPSIINPQGISAPTEQDLKISITGRDGEAKISSELDPNKYEVTYNKENNIWNNDDIQITVKPKHGNIFNNGSKYISFNKKAKINRMNMVVKPVENTLENSFYQKNRSGYDEYSATGLIIEQNKVIWVNPGNNKNISILIKVEKTYEKHYYLIPGTWNKIVLPSVNIKNAPLYIKNENLQSGMQNPIANIQFKAEKINFVPTIDIAKTSRENFEKQLKNNSDFEFVEIKSKHFIHTIGKRFLSLVSKNIDNIKENYNFYDKSYEFSQHLWGIGGKLQGASKIKNSKMHIVTVDILDHILGINSGVITVAKDLKLSGGRKTEGILKTMLSKIDYKKITLKEMFNKSDDEMNKYDEKLTRFGTLIHEINHTFASSGIAFKSIVLGETTPDIAKEILLKKTFGSYSFERAWHSFNKNNLATTTREKYQKFLKNTDPTKSLESTFTKRYNDKLIIFMQLYEAFGEEFFTNISHELRMLPEKYFSKNNDPKQINLFVWSKVTGYNLLPFYEKWGLQPSSETKRKINALNLKPLQNNIWDYFVNTQNTPLIKKLGPINELDASQVFAKEDLIVGKNETLTEELIRSKLNLPSNFKYRISIQEDPLFSSIISDLIKVFFKGKTWILPSDAIKVTNIEKKLSFENTEAPRAWGFPWLIKTIIGWSSNTQQAQVKMLEKKIIKKIGLDNFNNANIDFKAINADDKSGRIIWSALVYISDGKKRTIKMGTVNGFQATDSNSINLPILETKNTDIVEVVISDNDPNTVDVKKVFYFEKKE